MWLFETFFKREDYPLLYQEQAQFDIQTLENCLGAISETEYLEWFLETLIRCRYYLNSKQYKEFKRLLDDPKAYKRANGESGVIWPGTIEVVDSLYYNPHLALNDMKPAPGLMRLFPDFSDIVKSGSDGENLDVRNLILEKIGIGDPTWVESFVLKLVEKGFQISEEQYQWLRLCVEDIKDISPGNYDSLQLFLNKLHQE